MTQIERRRLKDTMAMNIYKQTEIAKQTNSNQIDDQAKKEAEAMNVHNSDLFT